MVDKNMAPTGVFIHGLEGSRQGVKGSFFRERYPDMIVEDFLGPFEERMVRLNSLLANKSDLILVGSSLGGLMATVFAIRLSERDAKKIGKLILLAPALNHLPPEICRGVQLDFPVIIYHGSRDDVVPSGPVKEIAGQLFANLEWHLVDDDHSLHQTFFSLPWDDLLS